MLGEGRSTVGHAAVVARTGDVSRRKARAQRKRVKRIKMVSRRSGRLAGA
jgi:hypothetical protein